MKLTLLAGQQSQALPLSGQFIYVKSCPSTIEIKAQTRKGMRIYQVASREQVQVPSDEAFTAITIVNRGGDGDIEIKTGFGQFIPTLDDLRVQMNFNDENGNAIPLPVYFNETPVISTKQHTGSIFTVENKARTVKAIGTGEIVLDSSAASIAEKLTRKKVVLQAPEDNSEDIVIGGFFRVRAGATEYLEATNELTVSGEIGDKLYVGEVS
jgi:hypothetical protein